MRVLVTGASGYIGSYFLTHYKDAYEIKTFSFLHDDFEALDLDGVDVVVHLSALVHQMGGASDEAYEAVNVTQTVQLAQKAKASGVGQFVFMSTVKVYGEETRTPYTEASACHPEDAYGKSKLKAEAALLGLEAVDFHIAIIRTPIVYGYGVKANIKNLVCLVKKVPILPFGAIKNARSMVYVGNLTHLIDTVITQKASGIYLAADDVPLSTTRLIKLIAQGLDKSVWLIRVPFFETFLKLFKPAFHKRLYGSLEVDNTLTKERLGLKSPYSVEEGIRLMLEGSKR